MSVKNGQANKMPNKKITYCLCCKREIYNRRRNAKFCINCVRYSEGIKERYHLVRSNYNKLRKKYKGVKHDKRGYAYLQRGQDNKSED